MVEGMTSLAVIPVIAARLWGTGHPAVSCPVRARTCAVSAHPAVGLLIELAQRQLARGSLPRWLR